MAIRITDIELDKKLKSYMANGGEQAFQIDDDRVFGATAPKRSVLIPRKLQTVAAVLLILVITALAIPQVSAAIAKFFTFIPGVGIAEKSEISFYAMKPIIRMIETDDALIYASLDNAIFDSGHLNISITVNGRNAGGHGVEFEEFLYDYANDFSLYVNGGQVDFQSSGWAETDTAITGINIWIIMQAPGSEDLFEVGIEGFSQRLSFTLELCRDYSDLSEIGPTEVHNNISITTTAHRVGDQLTVLYYCINSTDDSLSSIAGPFSDRAWKSEAYIITESGNKSMDIFPDGNRGKFVFDMPVGDKEATLYVPHIIMQRYEEKKITVPVPKDQSFIECDISVKYSLGTVKVTGVERLPVPNSDKMEILRIYFDYDSNESNVVIRSIYEQRFDYPKGWTLPSYSTAREAMEVDGVPSAGWGRSINAETGIMESFDIPFVEYGDPPKNFSFTPMYLVYCLTDEYVIPLDISE